MDASAEQVPDAVRAAYASAVPRTVAVTLGNRVFMVRVVPGVVPLEDLWREFIGHLRREHLI